MCIIKLKCESLKWRTYMVVMNKTFFEAYKEDTIRGASRPRSGPMKGSHKEEYIDVYILGSRFYICNTFKNFNMYC